MDRDRDIDYAAAAVQRALAEKFSRYHSLDELRVTAQERTILVHDGHRTAEGTRDNLLAAVRKADTYENFWEELSSAPSQRV